HQLRTTVHHPVSPAIAQDGDNNINRKCFPTKSPSSVIDSTHFWHMHPPLNVVGQLRPVAPDNSSPVNNFLI
ncbi:hypothetical protein PanWU01x14_239080, partial [Parasponia andersonii]